MPEYPHDPEFPYLLVHETGGVLAKFKEKRFAIDRSEDIAFADDYSVIDTTPKPRIPVDATVISWSDGAYLPQIAQKNPKQGPAGIGWYADIVDGGRWYSESALLEIIGDAEITVLDPRKEES